MTGVSFTVESTEYIVMSALDNALPILNLLGPLTMINLMIKIYND